MPRTRKAAPPGRKHCHLCCRNRLLEAFARDASKSDCLRSCCRACDAKRLKAAYWTKDRKKARKLRQAAAERRELERQHGRQRIAHQEALRAEEEKAKRVAQSQARRELASRRFWEGMGARQGSRGEQT
ncbi:hypothetical protein [Altererythrobacter sp. TH136]|uniref:hypothetical protein n=1 Tax=Altererythrobacter sp. TH136 TaxID=2067415 RepID=UPI001163D2CA|nr:hypothetical protein [Altererythrobacter sp. TH136]QDM41442.1 hypothetical protein C0V74_10620 [Altererythrobacter sp. TH136]